MIFRNILSKNYKFEILNVSHTSILIRKYDCGDRTLYISIPVPVKVRRFKKIEFQVSVYTF